MYKLAFLNLFLRGLTIFSKFLLTFYMAKYMTPEELGIYGIFAVTITLSVLIVGFDFYMYANRETLQNKEESLFIIRDQFIFYLIMYVLVFPVLSILFFYDFLLPEYIIMFYILLILEHLSQELYRILILSSKPIAANLLLFIRSGFWVYILITLFFMAEFKSLSYIFIFWIIGSFVSVLYGLYSLRGLNFKKTFNKSINWNFVKKGITVSVPFFISTIIFKGIEFSDRYLLQYFYSEVEVGIYTFYMQIANIIQVVVFTGVVTIFFPKALAAYQEGNNFNYQYYMNKMKKGILLAIAICLLLFPIILFVVLKLVDNNIYERYIIIFWFLMVAVSLLSVSLIPHYDLYIRKKESKILRSTVITFFFSILISFILIPLFSLLGAALAVCISMAILTVTKFYYSLKN